MAKRGQEIAIHDIEGATKQRSIVVRILRLVKHTDKEGMTSFDMICLDSQGSKIQVFVHKKIAKNFKDMFTECGIVKITNFVVINNEIQQWQKTRINHQSKLVFSFATKVSNVDTPVSISDHGLQLSSFEDIVKGGIPIPTEGWMLDVIGEVILPLGEAQFIQSRNAKLLDIELIDTKGNALTAVLWDNHAEDMKKFINGRDDFVDESVILILQMVQVSMFKGDKNHGEVEIKIPNDILIRYSVNTISAIVDCKYPNLMHNKDVDGFFQNRAILAPTNEIVDSINEHVMSLFPGKEVEYMSSDAICKDKEFNQSAEDIFSTEFLNTVKCSRIPNHILKLKIGCIVMLLRNIYQALELCNGTRLIVTNLGKHVVEAVMLSGKNVGKKVLIPKMIMSPSNTTKFPVRFQRRQFPLTISYAMTINKSQGQSLAHVGLFLSRPVFSHGQLYVDFSRVTTRKGLKVLICNSHEQSDDTTTNVVYKEVFDKL